MRRTWLFVVALAPAACSLLVDSSGLSGGAQDAATTDTRSVDDATPASSEAGTDAVSLDAGNPDAPPDDAGTPDVTADASDGGASTSAAYRSAVLADGPWAYYRFEGSSGCADEKGGTPCALSASGITHSVAGIAGSRAVRLDLLTATVTTTLATGDLSQSYTVEAWIAVDAASVTPSNDLVDFEDFAPSRAGLTAFLFTANQFRTETWSGGDLLSYTLAAASLTPSVFHHVVLGYDATTKLDFTYFDGALSEGGFQYDAGRPVVNHPFVWSGWTGSIDELAIYSKALTPARILAHYGLR